MVNAEEQVRRVGCHHCLPLRIAFGGWKPDQFEVMSFRVAEIEGFDTSGIGQVIG